MHAPAPPRKMPQIPISGFDLLRPHLCTPYPRRELSKPWGLILVCPLHPKRVLQFPKPRPSPSRTSAG
eukprot:scaffold35560_cov90-Isochrysis_galbana.AAC.1